MKRSYTVTFLVLTGIALTASAGKTVLFSDEFHGKLGPGWRWVRENPGAWRTTESGLEIRIEPGNMWGKDNNARNVLVRDLPQFANGALSTQVTVENRPASRYEQVDLVWYYDDSNMVKIGLELVDGEVCMVMGREENDETRTIAKPPIGNDVSKLHLRLTARDNEIAGAYRVQDSTEWKNAGECKLPVKGDPKISLQVYQGPKDAEHWARFTGFTIMHHK